MNYTQIADRDPGGDLQSAYDTMSALKVSSTKSKRITDIDMAGGLGFTKATRILDGIQSAIDAGELPARVMKWIENVGLDINHSETVAILNSLVPTYVDENDSNDLKEMGKVPEFPGLTINDVKKARRLRAEGKA